MSVKLIKLGTSEGPVIGLLRDLGRVERLGDHPELLERVVNCWNACDGLSDASVRLMASGGTKAGTLVERTVAWSMFYSHNNRMALKILEKARAEIAKLNQQGDSV